MAKETTCSICGNSVSKRQSLEIEKGKRACRTHQEVIDMLNKQEEEKKSKKMLEEINDKMTVISAVSFVRVLHSMHNTPIGVIMNRVRSKYSNAIYTEIEAELEKQGYQMSDDEMQQSIAMAITMKQKGMV